MTLVVTANSVKSKALSLGFDKVGIAKAISGKEQARLVEWLRNGYQADLTWMENTRRQDITQVMPGVRSVISVALNYYTPHRHNPSPGFVKISRYGWGRDYHRVLGKKLKELCGWLQAEGGGEARYYVDTGPIAEKAWAERSGLGWIGKHSNLITREYGSWVFLGEVLTTLELAADRPHPEHCGTCTRCIEACPTQAIVEPFVVDANRCIAYHTIENRAERLPDAIGAHLQSWVAGCDICQEVCPWNQRFAQETPIAAFHPYRGNLHPTVEELLAMDEWEWDRRFIASALRRIKLTQWHRNARAAAQRRITPNSPIT